MTILTVAFLRLVATIAVSKMAANALVLFSLMSLGAPLTAVLQQTELCIGSIPLVECAKTWRVIINKL